MRLYIDGAPMAQSHYWTRKLVVLDGAERALQSVQFRMLFVLASGAILAPHGEIGWMHADAFAGVTHSKDFNTEELRANITKYMYSLRRQLGNKELILSGGKNTYALDLLPNEIDMNWLMLQAIGVHDAIIASRLALIRTAVTAKRALGSSEGVARG